MGLYPVKWMALDQLNVFCIGGCCCGRLGKSAFTIFEILGKGNEIEGKASTRAFSTAMWESDTLQKQIVVLTILFVPC